MTHAWTAAEVWELVKDWPDEARGDVGLEYQASDGFPLWTMDCSGIQFNASEDGDEWKGEEWTDPGDSVSIVPPRAAASLHIASGIEWLGTIHTTAVGRYQDGRWMSLTDYMRDGPTLLHAIAAAIRATKGETR